MFPPGAAGEEALKQHIQAVHVEDDDRRTPPQTPTGVRGVTIPHLRERWRPGMPGRQPALQPNPLGTPLLPSVYP